MKNSRTFQELLKDYPSDFFKDYKIMIHPLKFNFTNADRVMEKNEKFNIKLLCLYLVHNIPFILTLV